MIKLINKNNYMTHEQPSSDELAVRSPVDVLIETNEILAASIARDVDRFNADGADLLVRNMATILEWLSASEFNALSRETRDKVAVLARISQDVAPIEDAKLARYSDEDDETYEYRTKITDPILSFQLKLANGDFDISNALNASKIRCGISAVGGAIGSTLNETQGLPKIARKVNFLQRNTSRALSTTNQG